MILIYTKTGCPWCVDVLEYLRENKIDFEERNLYDNAIYADEMKEKSGQGFVPTLDIQGYILANTDVDEVREHLEGKVNI